MSTASTTLASSIAAQLRTLITEGKIAPAEKLRLDDLRASFGVSLSPLREALSRLGSEGFVVAEDQRGWRVSPVSESNLLEVTTLRCQIETFALREAIRKGDLHWEGEVVACLHRLGKHEKRTRGQPRIAEWETAHRELHQALVSGCGMPLLLQYCSTLHDLGDRYRRLFLEKNPLDRDVPREHSLICEAALKRNADKACALLRDHIERTGTNVMKALTARRPAARPH